LKENTLFTGELRETFSEYYNKCFHPVRKRNNNEFVHYKYFTHNGKGDDEESEDSESDYEENEDWKSKDLLLKEIELIFENMYFCKNIEKMFPSFFAANAKKINLPFTQVLDERFKTDQTLKIDKNIDIYKSM
jgi:hypothetical protein